MANVERLEHLITVLERPEVQGHFDMEIYACGTSACVAGWAGKDPLFNKQGFECSGIGPSFDGKEDELALKLFFGITAEQVEFIFYDDMHTEDRHSIPAAIQRIRDVLAQAQQVAS